jgi:hypothetical protein
VYRTLRVILLLDINNNIIIYYLKISESNGIKSIFVRIPSPLLFVKIPCEQFSLIKSNPYNPLPFLCFFTRYTNQQDERIHYDDRRGTKGPQGLYQIRQERQRYVTSELFELN